MFAIASGVVRMCIVSGVGSGAPGNGSSVGLATCSWSRGPGFEYGGVRLLPLVVPVDATPRYLESLGLSFPLLSVLSNPRFLYVSNSWMVVEELIRFYVLGLCLGEAKFFVKRMVWD